MLPLTLTVLNMDEKKGGTITPTKNCLYKGEHPKGFRNNGGFRVQGLEYRGGGGGIAAHKVSSKRKLRFLWLHSAAGQALKCSAANLKR